MTNVAGVEIGTMQHHFWLIHRGSIRLNNESYDGIFGGSPGRLVNPDYMGSAEFEWGAVPAAYSRIMYRFQNYALFTTKYKDVHGKQLYVFCEKDHYDELMRELIYYKQTEYHLKEYSGFAAHFKFRKENDSVEARQHDFLMRTDFWWCIDQNNFRDPTGRRIGDWMAFVADERIQKHFTEILENDYKEFMEMPEEERIDRCRKAGCYIPD